MKEPSMSINGHQLTDAQAMTIRVAIEDFDASLANDGLGDDEHGRNMVTAYRARIVELRLLIRSRNGDKHE